jgi:hypothetical protein
MPLSKRIRPDSESRACQFIQFVNGIGEPEALLLGAFVDIPAFKAILFRALPGDVPRVRTCRHTFCPPEGAGIQRYVSPPARNTGTFPCKESKSRIVALSDRFRPVCLPMIVEFITRTNKRRI